MINSLLKSKSTFGNSFLNLVGKQVRNIDKFGHPISLTYKRDSTFKSTFGGIMTIFSVLSLLAFFAIQLKIVINREQYTINNTNYVKDLYEDNRENVFELSSFDFAAQLTYRGQDPAILEDNLHTYFSIQFFDYYSFIKPVQKEGEFPQTITLNYLPIEKCTNQRFRNRSKDDVTKWWCPQVQNWTLRGSIAAMTRRFIAMKVTLCNQQVLNANFPGQTCKTAAQSEALASQMTLLIAELTQYFESASFDNPIKYSIKSQSLYMGTDSKIMFFKLGKQIAYLKDSQFHQSQNQQNLSYTTFVFDYSDTRKRFDDSFINIYIYQDENVSTTTRQVFNILDALSTSGGFSSIIMLFFAIVTKRIQKQLYFITLLKKLFIYLNDYDQRVQGSKNIDQRRRSNLIQLSFQSNANQLRATPKTNSYTPKGYDETQKENIDFGLVREFEVIKNQTKNKILKDSQLEKGKINKNKKISNLMSSDGSQSGRQFLKESTPELMDSPSTKSKGKMNFQQKVQALVEQRIKGSNVFDVSANQYLLDNIISTLLCCFKRPPSKQQSLIKSGIQHLLKEFDMIRFLKKARIADSLGQITLTKFQRDLIPYLNNNILTTRSNFSNLNSEINLPNQTMRNTSNIVSQYDLPNQIQLLFRENKPQEMNQRLFENLIFEQEYLVTESDSPTLQLEPRLQKIEKSDKVKNKSSKKVKTIKSKSTNPNLSYKVKDSSTQIDTVKNNKAKNRKVSHNDKKEISPQNLENKQIKGLDSLNTSQD
eukprot:403354895